MLDMIKEWRNVSEYKEIVDYVENGTTARGFGDSTQVSIVSNDKTGVIGIKQFFEDSQTDFEILTVSELEQKLENCSNDWEDGIHDNTYNYNGSLEREMDYRTIRNVETDEVIAFYSIHVGLDVRAGYTNAFAVLYSDNYNFQEHIYEDFPIGYFEFKQNKESYFISIDGSATSEYSSVYIANENNNEVDFDYSEEISLYFRNIVDIEEYLDDNEVEYDKGTLKNLSKLCTI